MAERGLAWDRAFCLVRAEDHSFVTLRQLSGLTKVEVQLDLKEQLMIVSNVGDASRGKLRVPLVAASGGGEEFRVRIWDDEVMGQAVSREADGWFSDVLGVALRLVRIGKSFARQIPETKRLGNVNNEAAFSDGYAYLLTTTRSLAQVSRQAGEEIDMRRFRPNIVVDNQRAGEDVAPFEEDQWSSLSIGRADFFTVAACARCKIPRMNPDSGLEHPAQHPTSALQTLGHFYKSEAYFGIHLAHTPASQNKVISVGDAVTLHRRFAASLVGWESK